MLSEVFRLCEKALTVGLYAGVPAVLFMELYLLLRRPDTLKKFDRKSVGEIFSRRASALVIFSVVVGLFARTPLLNAFTGSDEPTFIYVAKLVYEGKKPYVDFFFSQPPLDVYMVAGLFRLFGLSLFHAKILPFVCSILSFPLVYALSGYVSVKPVDRALTMFVYSTSILAIMTSQMVWLHATHFLLIPLSTLLFFKGIRNKSSFLFFVSGCIASVAVYSKVLSLILPFIQILFLLLRPNSKQKTSILSYVAGFAIPVILFFPPLISDQFIHDVIGYHMSRSGTPDILKLLYVLPLLLNDPIIIFFGALGFIQVLLNFRLGNQTPYELFIGLYCLSVLCVIFFIPFEATIGNVISYGNYLIIPFALLAGRPLSSVRGQHAFIMLFFIIILATTYILAIVTNLQWDASIRQTAEYLTFVSPKGGVLTGDPVVSPSIAFISNYSIPPEGVELYLPYRASNEPDVLLFYERITANATYALLVTGIKPDLPFYEYIKSAGIYQYKDDGFNRYIEDRFKLENQTGKITIYSKAK
ncbi:Dolichyl-phosphate-mannose-protein mannosyltransferase [uncultured archaeon]|nr:Dolichyl-phosphate-mannose-protein mannosyltransferase [uncultured archaeon]